MSLLAFLTLSLSRRGSGVKLRTLVIHNFRCIIHETISLTDYFLVIGSNNAGKSTVVDCLRAFYEKDGFKYKEERDFPFLNADGEDSYLDLNFELNGAEYESLKEEYRLPGNRLAVRKYFKAPADKTRVNSIYALQADGTHADEQFYGAKNVQQGKFGNLIYIPATSNINDLTKLTGPSVLRDLLADIMQTAIQESPAFKGLTEQFESFAQTAKTTASPTGRSLGGLETDITEMLGPWSASFKIDIGTPSVAEILKSLVSFSCHDTAHDRPIQAEQFGSGFQRHFIYSLINVGAKYGERKPSKKTTDFQPDLTLVLFEEPEAFLHPPQQNKLSASLQEMAKTGSHQVICTTHSPIFMSKSMDKITSISRARRSGANSSIFQVNDKQLQEIIDDNHLIIALCDKHKVPVTDDDRKFIMEEIKYALWMNSERCSAFFASHIVLVEGPSEKVLIEKLIADGMIKMAQEPVYFLDCFGKYNINRFMNLAAALGLSHSIIIDADNTPFHTELNKLIKDNSKPDLTVSIVNMRGDLETFLGVKPTRPDRKPQHLLIHYSEGRIDKKKLKAFCTVVEQAMAMPKQAT